MAHQSGGHRGGSDSEGPRPSASTSRGPAPPTQQLQSMNIRGRLAVDGSPLAMGSPVAVPTAKPMPSLQVHPKEPKKVLDMVQAAGMANAEFPLREAFTNPNTTVYTNHFVVKVDDTKPLYDYDIVGVPRQASKKTARKLIQALIDRTPVLVDNRDNFATDFASKLVSWVKLPDRSSKAVQSAEWRAPIALGLQYSGLVDTDLLRKYAQGKVEPTKDVEARIKLANTALNLVVSTALQAGTFSPKANKFFITGGHTDLGSSFYAVRGYYYAIRPGMGEILLNLSTCTSAFYKPMLVSDFLKDTTTFRSLQERLSQLRGLRVQLEYEPVHTGRDPRPQAATIDACMKTIAGTGDPATEQKFRLKSQSGKPAAEVTVQAYFERTYNVTLRYPMMPVINCGTDSRPTWYPAEKLFILPFQLFKRTVPDTLTAGMIDAACHFPETTRALIEHEGLRKLNLIPGAGLKQLGTCPAIRIDSRMLQIPATILPFPKAKYADGTVSLSKENPNWNLHKRKFLITNSKAVVKVFVITVPRDDGEPSVMHDENMLNQMWTGFQKTMQDTYATANFQFVAKAACPDFAAIDSNAARTVMGQAKAQGANFVILFLEKKSAAAYAHFKDLADRQYGLHSLCITWDKKRGFNPQYWANVALKLNLKAGGINHTVEGIEATMKDTLVLGADVTHPGQGSRLGTPSIAAVVGSVNRNAGQFLGSMRLQPRNTALEIIQDMKSMAFERIKAWYMSNGRKLPRNILFYRDGVSDSQYSQVKEQELPQIRVAFDEVAKAAGLTMIPHFNLTALVVGKRHHVKLFPTTNDAMPKNRNCKPGTLVDTTITSPYFRDFYLQSHNSIKGTAKSAHYFPLVNEMGLSEFDIQSFTHKLCYTYVRATMGVSYAPPAYYADRLCERGRCYLRDFFNPKAGTPWTNQPKKLKNQRMNDAQAAREIKYRTQRMEQIYNGKKTIEKSKAELEKEIADEIEIEELVKAMTLKQAKQAFYGGQVERNPWSSNISNSMFWM